MKNIRDKSFKELEVNDTSYHYYSLKTLIEQGYDIEELPYSVKVLLEAALRQMDGHSITPEHVENLANWSKMVKNNQDMSDKEVPFKPARVILQDFTGVPAVVDLASMRKAMGDANGDVESINPEVPVDLVIDHSVQVDKYGTDESFEENMIIEFDRNKERYQFLNWAQKAFDNFRVIPPATGIVHQVNLEYLANVVSTKVDGDKTLVFPDSLVGTDSHTTMINGLGVLGWGVGGIEAEAGMLGEPSFFPMPEVIGVRLTGRLSEGVTATDLTLRVTQLLRQHGVVGKFVEYFGSGIKELTLADRATVANMSPEYGATCGFFPVDEETLNYLRLTGRKENEISLVKAYLEENEMFYVDGKSEPVYSEIIELDISTVEVGMAGPKRPQDRVLLKDMKKDFIESVTRELGVDGHGLPKEEFNKSVSFKLENGKEVTLETGSLTLASITSCTNTSNPFVMLGAGLLAKKAVEKGMEVPAYVKTSLAPGSRVVTAYLESAGLQEYLDQLGFNNVGYGCATCIGNSGPFLPEIEKAITDNDLLVSSVLSGNRNFEGRIHSLVKANYLASPVLVVAYALAGTVNIDLRNDSLGSDKDGNPVYLKDIWPSSKEIEEVIEKNVKPEMFNKEYETVYSNNKLWNNIEVGQDSLYEFDKDSTYIQNPSFFTDLAKDPEEISKISNLRVIAKLGDTITTDHISPAGAIGANTPAGKYLMEKGIEEKDFNTYGARRGNHEVMMRGTFANIRIRNQIAAGTEGGYTTYWPTKEVMPIFDACEKYKESNTGLIVLAGKDYGMGSSRDWAAKGPNLLGVKAVIAESYERIHRSNLVMMGVLPLQYLKGQTAESLGLTGEEAIEIIIDSTVTTKDIVKVTASLDGEVKEFEAVVRFDSEVDIDYYRHGGILQMVLRDKLNRL